MDQRPLTFTVSKSVPIAFWLVFTVSALDGDRADLQKMLDLKPIVMRMIAQE